MDRRKFLLSGAAWIVTAPLTPGLIRAAAAVESGSREVHTYGLVGDCGWRNNAAIRLRDSLRRSSIRKLVMPGDNLYDLNDTFAQTWDPWRKEGFEFSAVAIGNHTSGFSEECQYFGMPGEFYSYEDGPCLFIVLNSENQETVEVQAEWLREELHKARSPFVFIVVHHPPLTVSDFHPWQERRHFHQRIRPIIRAYSKKITAVIAGHDHIAGLYDMSGIPMIVSGAGVETRPAKWAKDQADDFVLKTHWVYGQTQTWTRMDANERTGEVWINYVDVPRNVVTCSALITAKPMQVKDHHRLEIFRTGLPA